MEVRREPSLSGEMEERLELFPRVSLRDTYRHIEEQKKKKKKESLHVAVNILKNTFRLSEL